MAVSVRYDSKKLGPAEVLTEAEIRRLLATFSKRAPSAIRDRALVLLLWRTGLRISEALTLELRDLDLDGDSPTLQVRDGKGGKARKVGIHQEAVAGLERWLAERSRLGLGRRRHVFCTISSHIFGQPLHAGATRQMLTRRAARAGLGRVHPHAFRATLAVELAREGVPLPAIRDVLGHANLSQTDAYLRRVFPQDAISAVTERSPEHERRRRLAAALAKLDEQDVSELLDALASA